MRTNFVLIDYENVQPAALECLNHDHFKIIVFVGANQTKVPVEIAVALQELGSRATYVKMSGNGTNALDFHIAFYIGLLAAQEPRAYFHIISKDTGFDPLIQHLKSKKIFAKRVCDVTDITISDSAQATPKKAVPAPIAPKKAAQATPKKAAQATPKKAAQATSKQAAPAQSKQAAPATRSDQVEVVIANFQKRGHSSHRTVKTLTTTLNAVFAQKLSSVDIEGLITELQKRGIIQINDTNITYVLPH